MSAHVFIATSVDGYIARRNGGLDWLPESPEDHGYDAFMASVDAVVMGRNTYETVLSFGVWPFTKPVYVLTTRPLPAPLPDGAVVEAMSGAPEQVVSGLAARGVREFYLDGGIAIQRFLRAGLIRRLVVTRVPVLLGSGIPLFGELAGDVRLRHVVTRSYASGLVQSEYEVGA